MIYFLYFLTLRATFFHFNAHTQRESTPSQANGKEQTIWATQPIYAKQYFIIMEQLKIEGEKTHSEKQSFRHNQTLHIFHVQFFFSTFFIHNHEIILYV